MAREDFDRRRLRSIYDRNKRRVSALADLRDSRRVYVEEERAPRRYTVSERRTRMEGFGRGGAQVRRVVRPSMRDRLAPRFADRRVFRRGNRDRFVREEDRERQYLRERFLEDRRRRDTDGGRRYRPRLNGRFKALLDRLRGGNPQRNGDRNRNNSNQQGNNRNSKNNGSNLPRQQSNGNRQQQRSDRRSKTNNNNNNNNSKRNARGSNPQYSKAQLDDQLDNYLKG